ncbi:MAG TPA: indole-3-glycerol-phosphate synthase [Sulfolobales archaeon]|nr:indole-3-glycerol-phosphate synthase [Sulfolobales archaeon]
MGFLSDVRDRWRRIGIFSLVANNYERVETHTTSLSSEITRWRKERGIAIIAEYKRASPTGIIDLDLDIRDYYYQLHSYVAGFSVIVEREWFSGSPEYISILRHLGWRGPVLAKGFVFYKDQINIYRNAGASSVLLIAEALDPVELRDLYIYSESLGLEPLVEVGSIGALDSLMRVLSPRIVGVNSRDLETLEVSLSNMLGIIKHAKREYPDLLIVAESGMKDLDDIWRARESGADACLIGTGLVRRSDRVEMLSKLYSTLREA